MSNERARCRILTNIENPWIYGISMAYYIWFRPNFAPIRLWIKKNMFWGPLGDIWALRPQKSKKSQKMTYFLTHFCHYSHCTLPRIGFHLGIYIMECLNDKTIIHLVPGVVWGWYLAPKGPKITKNHPKLTIFHIFWALEPYHPYIESNFSLVHTWLIECSIEKIIIHRASVVGYGVISGHQRSQKS